MKNRLLTTPQPTIKQSHKRQFSTPTKHNFLLLASIPTEHIFQPPLVKNHLLKFQR